MHSKNDNIEIMIDDKGDEVFSLLNRYQIGFETSMRSIDFIFDYVHLLYYKSHKINFKQDGSYIDSLDLMKRATISLSIQKIVNAFNTL